MPSPWPATEGEALLAVAILARDADGLVRPEELHAITDHLPPTVLRMDRPTRMKAAGRLASLLEEHGLEVALQAVRQALPEPASRLAAVQLAFRIAWSDDEIHPMESDHLALVARTLGVDGGRLEPSVPRA